MPHNLQRSFPSLDRAEQRPGLLRQGVHVLPGSGAGGQLELKFQTAPKPGTGGGSTGGGSSSGGGGGSSSSSKPSTNTGTTTKPDGTKVQTETKADGTKGSPKTFDAGIGIYAVTAVLSVTGMAWTAKKRH